MAQFLACYDYGTGGVWLYIEAESAAQLVERYPALTVVDEPPAWLTPEREQELRAKVGDPWWSNWLESLPRS
jgi:hypothetical protein